jgi:hypothetical protein
MTTGAAEALRPSRVIRGFGPGAVRTALVILAGSALGPQGLGLLSAGVLASLELAMPVAVAGLGVYLGLRLNLRTGPDWRSVSAAAVRSLVIIIIVAAGAVVLLSFAGPMTDAPRWFNSAFLAISAAADPFAVLLGGAVLALLRHGTPAEAGLLLLQAAAVTLAIASAGWLLLSRSAPGTEQRTFVIALLLLLGGASEYLALSALAAGLVAGVIWETAGGSTRTAIRRDVQYVQQPLIVLILAVSGARLELTPAAIAIALPYLILRLLAATAGSAVAQRLAPASSDTDSGLSMSPGIVGLAFALNAARAIGSDANTLITIVVVGSVGSQLVGPLLGLRGTAE